LKSYNLSRAIFTYEKYLASLRKSSTNQGAVQTGEKIIEGLKSVAEEIKKKQNLMKNKEDSKRVYDELCKKYVNRLYWEDLEKPIRFVYENNTDNAIYNLLKKGFIRTSAEQ
jgi:hypothetical protein